MIRLYPEEQSQSVQPSQKTGKRVRLYQDTPLSQPIQPKPNPNANLGLPPIGGSMTTTPIKTSQSGFMDKVLGVGKFILGLNPLNPTIPGLNPRPIVETLKNPLQALKEAGQTAIQTFPQAIQNVRQAEQEYKTAVQTPGTPFSQRLATGAGVVSGVAGVAFSPISAIFSAAEKIPALKPAVDLINLPFVVSGKVGEFSTKKFIDVLPISQQSKDILKPAFGELGSLAAQVILGGKIIELVTKGAKIDPKSVQDAVKKIKVESVGEPQVSGKVNVKVIKETPKIRLYPALETARKAKINYEKSGEVLAQELGYKPETPSIRGTGETKTPQLSLGVEAKAIENKLTKSLGKLPEYRQVNMKEQAKLSENFVRKDYETAKKIAKGEELPPNNILPESIFTAVENKALAKGDVLTLRELATGGLSTEATVMGQRIRALAEREPESAVSTMKELSKSRAEKAQTKFKDIDKVKEINKQEIKNEMNKTMPKIKDWNDLLNSIACK